MKTNVNDKYDSIMFEEYIEKEEKNTNELSSNEIDEIISSVEESKSSVSSKKDLFTVVRPKIEKKDSYDILEIYHS